MTDYASSFEIEKSSSSVFQAISKELVNWWGKQEPLVEEKGTLFKVSWGEPWYLFKVVAYQKNRLMVWECIDANQKIEGLAGVEKEWVGTQIHWELQELSDHRTVLHFRHEGLVPEFLCFDFCSASWDHFLKESLVAYLHEK